MLQMKDMTKTLILIMSLGLLLVLIQGYFKGSIESFTDAVQCGANMPCDVGLKCINGFCAKTERLRMYDKDADNQDDLEDHHYHLINFNSIQLLDE